MRFKNSFQLIFIPAILFALMSIPSFGQFSKGSFLVGGNVTGDVSTSKSTFGNTTTTNSTTTTFSLEPQAGYFLIDNLAAGIALSFSTSSLKNEVGSGGISSTYFAFSPFARYYYQKFFGQAQVSFGAANSKSTNSNGSSSTSDSGLFGWSLAGGYAIMLNDHVAIEPQLGYKYLSSSLNSTTSTSNGGLFIQIGFQVYLHK